MAVQLDLSYKPRRPQGLRPKDYQLESLLEKGPQLKTKSASPFSDILAPPEDTSDETSIRSEKTDVSSDDSLSGVGKGKRESPTFRDTGKASKPTSPKEESGDLLYKEPSNIAAPIFTSSKVSQNRYGSQSSQKRKSAIKDEEEEDIFGMGMTSSQPKKVRKDYSVNVHKRSSVEEKKVTKPASRGSQRRKDEFHVPHTHALLAQADKWKKLEAETGEISFKKPPSSSSSPWSQRTSQRSTSSTQLSSQGSQKPKFKMPLKKLTPKKRKADPVFHHVPATNEYGASGRVTRSSGSAKEALASADFNASDTTRTAVSIAADRLGMSVQLKPPPSSTGPSSAHSSFLDTVDPASPLTSPPEYSVMNPNQKNTYCITSEDMPVFTKKQGPSVCSFCKDTVENTFLEERMRIGKRLTIRQQAQFCKDHKRRAAEDEWRERGYPTIDWASFDGRLNHYHLALDNILQKRRTSFYRNAFGDLVKSGKNWTWQQDVMSGNRIEELSPGYYGGRGAKLMMENIMCKFAGKIRRLAKTDNLISTGGVSGFVQAVLVPELAVMLVHADMDIDDEEKAREVLRNSVDIGHMLNEEEDEVITDPDPEESQAMEEI